MLPGPPCMSSSRCSPSSRSCSCPSFSEPKQPTNEPKVPPISDALSTLSDRQLRRLLGARTFLRGLEYFRRRVVEDISVNDTTASGTVRATDSEPYPVTVE